MWDRIFTWFDNEKACQHNNMLHAFEQGSKGGYVVCDSANRVWGFGTSARAACIDVVKPLCSIHSTNQEILNQFYEDDFEVWSLLPACENVIAELQKKNRLGLDDFLIIKVDERGIAVI